MSLALSASPLPFFFPARSQHAGADTSSLLLTTDDPLGAKFVDTGVSADGAGGYARDLTADEKAQQAEKLAKAVALSDVVITTAAIPGKKAPIITFSNAVRAIKGLEI